MSADAEEFRTMDYRTIGGDEHTFESLHLYNTLKITALSSVINFFNPRAFYTVKSTERSVNNSFAGIAATDAGCRLALKTRRLLIASKQVFLYPVSGVR